MTPKYFLDPVPDIMTTPSDGSVEYTDNISTEW